MSHFNLESVLQFMKQKCFGYTGSWPVGPLGLENSYTSDEAKPTQVVDHWYYPSDIANDLQHVDLPEAVKEEVLACAWEYTRCVIPQYTNWTRYVAFMRTIVIGIIAEFRGSLVNVAAGNDILGYDLDAILDTLFLGTAAHQAAAREYRAFLLVTAEKSSSRRNGELFRRYVNALARSPRQWFRMRDADALARFTIASALACNNLDSVWFPDAELEIITEIGDTLYDAVAFFKHRSEAETNSTFAYMPSNLRVQAFRQARELLWAMDVALLGRPGFHIVTNFVRFFGGPIHIMMRRYRFVEEGLSIGRPETERVIRNTRQNFKLWNRVDATDDEAAGVESYRTLLARSEELMYSEMAEFLEDGSCPDCELRESYGTLISHQFGGVQLCQSCRDKWQAYLETLPERACKIFPELATVISPNTLE